MRVLSALMALLFLFGAAVQYNDPDPLQWVAIYIAAAVASLMAFRDRQPRWFAGLVGVVAEVWAATIARQVDLASLGHMFDEFEMHSLAVEEAREATGLLIIALWMAMLFWRASSQTRN